MSAAVISMAPAAMARDIGQLIANAAGCTRRDARLVGLHAARLLRRGEPVERIKLGAMLMAKMLREQQEVRA